MRTRHSSNATTSGFFLIALACSSNPASLGQYTSGLTENETGGAQATSSSTGGSASDPTTTLTGGATFQNAASTAFPPTVGGATSAPSTSQTGGGTAPASGGLTCPVFQPYTPIFYPGDVNSACPNEAPTYDISLRPCQTSQLGLRCAYPSSYAESQDIWTCSVIGGSYDDNGELIPGTTFNSWQRDTTKLCKRSGNNCLEAETRDVTGPRTQVTTPCADRAQTACHRDREMTAQNDLDNHLNIMIRACAEEAGSISQGAALSVWFEGE